MFYLAAAVSDFYVPWNSMVKILIICNSLITISQIINFNDLDLRKYNHPSLTFSLQHVSNCFQSLYVKLSQWFSSKVFGAWAGGA